MSGKRVKKLRKEAAKLGKDGVANFHSYKQNKKKASNPHYAPVTNLFPTPPGLQFTAPYVKARKEKDSE